MRRSVTDSYRILAAALLRPQNRGRLAKDGVENVDAVVGVGLGKQLAIFYADAERRVDHQRLHGLLAFEDEIEDIYTGAIVFAARPANGGESVGFGQQQGATGTLGCLVEDGAGTRYILSCNHVIAGLNAAIVGQTEVWQPGASDGGNTSHRIGVVYDYAPITFGSSTPNELDAAIALPDQATDVTTNINGIGTLKGHAAPLLNGSVQKAGKKTGVRSGVISFTRASQLLQYQGQSALFDGLIGILGTSISKPFADQGDSGAMVVDSNDNAVGMIISVATAHSLAFATPIEPILNYFGVDMA